MINNYEVAEILEIGRAQDVILGDPKLVQLVFDSPVEPDRNIEASDDE